MLTLGHQPQTGHMYISQSTLACTVSQSTLPAYLMCDACTHVLCHKAHYLSTLFAYNVQYVCTLYVYNMCTLCVHTIRVPCPPARVPYLRTLSGSGQGTRIRFARFGQSESGRRYKFRRPWTTPRAHLYTCLPRALGILRGTTKLGDYCFPESSSNFR